MIAPLNGAASSLECACWAGCMSVRRGNIVLHQTRVGSNRENAHTQPATEGTPRPEFSWPPKNIAPCSVQRAACTWLLSCALNYPPSTQAQQMDDEAPNAFSNFHNKEQLTTAHCMV